MKKANISIDCMGGDHGVTVTVPAALEFLNRYPLANVFLVGDEGLIASQLQKMHKNPKDFTIIPTTEVVRMEDTVEVALRRRRGSSMHRAIELVRDGQADACVSAGNTGALMAVSRFLLKTHGEIDRPAIATFFPNRQGGETAVLDLGANVDCTPHQLLQFAQMGYAFVRAMGKNDNPKVGLLNIGEEVMKGNDVLKVAGELLRASGLNFYGNVEGNDIYEGVVDVVVCDGLVGNIVLKSNEGLAKMIGGIIKEEFSKHWFNKILLLFAAPVLFGVKKRLDPRVHAGAALLGLRGLVVKSHGSSDIFAYRHALERAYSLIENQLSDQLYRALHLSDSANRNELENVHE